MFVGAIVYYLQGDKSRAIKIIPKYSIVEDNLLSSKKWIGLYEAHESGKTSIVSMHICNWTLVYCSKELQLERDESNKSHGKTSQFSDIFRSE